MVEKVVQVAIHDLKRKGPSDFETILGKAQLTISPTVIRVVTQLHELYASRASKAHGQFSEDLDHYPTQTYVSEFHAGGYQDFTTLTKKLMATLTAQARRKPGAAGGHVLFAHIEKDSNVFLMVAIVTDKLGALLTNELDMADSWHLDLENFRFAGRINITAWLAHADRYIGFLRGKKDVAEYFKEFLGCSMTNQDKTDTSRLIQLLDRFAEPANGKVKDKPAFLKRAFEICERHILRNEPLDFTAFANELYPDDPDVLTKVLGDPDVALGDGFVPNRRALSALVKYRARTPFWSVEFDRRAITQGKVVYDPEKKTITMNDLPAELVQELERNRE